ncbi:MAG: hypothetical protein IJZ07_02050 [Clostridia bacterium]|nr:hypothetical protein [Clostridia bacterium]
MKRIVIYVAVLVFCFAAVYLMISYFPGAQIKLSAPPEVYFVENLKKLWFLKSAISGVVSLVVSGITYYKIK